MPSFSFLEEFSVIRAKYKTAFSDLMQAAARTTGTDVRHMAGNLILIAFQGCQKVFSSRLVIKVGGSGTHTKGISS